MRGIYAIRNSVNGKVYVGCSEDIQRRWTVHRYELSAGWHGNRHLQSSVRKHTIQAFEFLVLELVQDGQLLHASEQRWIDQLRATDRSHGYNIVPDSRHKLLSEETRRLLSTRRLGRPLAANHRANIARGLRGKPKSPSHRAKLRSANLGKKFTKRGPWKTFGRTPSVITRQKISAALMGHVCLEETRRKISERKLGRPCPKRCVTTEVQQSSIMKRRSLGANFSQLAREYGISRVTVRNIVTGRYGYGSRMEA